jgi:hypothetical protein
LNEAIAIAAKATIAVVRAQAGNDVLSRMPDP